MLQEKKISSKINYDVLKSLNTDGSVDISQESQVQLEPEIILPSPKRYFIYLYLRRQSLKDGEYEVKCECDECLKFWEVTFLLSKTNYSSKRAIIRIPMINMVHFCLYKVFACILDLQPRERGASTLPLCYPAIRTVMPFRLLFVNMNWCFVFNYLYL